MFTVWFDFLNMLEFEMNNCGIFIVGEYFLCVPFKNMNMKTAWCNMTFRVATRIPLLCQPKTFNCAAAFTLMCKLF